MKTVLHTISAEDVFGPEKTVINECLALDGSAGWRGRIVNFWSGEEVPITRKAREAGVPYECIASSSKFDWGAIRALAAQLRADPQVVVHSHGYKADLYTLVAARLAGVPVMSTAHGWTSENAKVRLYERLQAFLWRFFDRVIAVSHSYRRLAEAAGVRPSKMAVVHNAIRANYKADDAADRARARTLLGLAEGEHAVAVIGRLGIEKGHRVFVDAAARLAPRFPQARFLIIGEGAQRAEIEAQVAALGLGGMVRLLGHRNDLPALYPGLDLMAMTSLREGLPNVLLEAMLHGVPGVCMAVGGIPEVIDDGVDGLLVPPGDLDRFTAGLERFFADEALRQRCGAAAIDKVRRGFLFDARMQRMVGHYEELLAMRPRGATTQEGRA